MPRPRYRLLAPTERVKSGDEHAFRKGPPRTSAGMWSPVGERGFVRIGVRLSTAQHESLHYHRHTGLVPYVRRAI